MFVPAGRGLDVVSSREREEDPFHCSTGVCETGESRVSHLRCRHLSGILLTLATFCRFLDLTDRENPEFLYSL